MPIFFKNKNQSSPKGSFFKEALVFFWELFKVVVISLAIIIPIRYFLIQPFYVKGASMEPNFLDHEYLIIDELSYRFRAPLRGEVVVFRYPLNPKDHFIKRIIGLPNETIKISEGQIIIYNDQNPDGLILEEGYLDSDSIAKGDKLVVLKDDEYFLMGDNRIFSLDSRYFGPVIKKYITGRVLLRGWPISRFGFFLEPPQYNL